MGFCLLQVPGVNYLLLTFFAVLLIEGTNADKNDGFTFNGNLNLGGLAEISSDGLFRLTNQSRFGMGHVFYTSLTFKNTSSSSSNNKSLSFSTTFVFAIVPEGDLTGHGMAFLLSPTKEMAGRASSSQHLGLFNWANNGNSSNHIVAIEFDTFRNQEFNDIDSNHVGIDVNGLESVISASAGYFSDDDQTFRNLSLANGERLQVWVDYNSTKEMLDVTLCPMGLMKPKTPLLSLNIDISSVILDRMYVGFASATGQLIQSAYVLGWSFILNGQAASLDLSKLPDLPLQKSRRKSKSKKIFLIIGLSVVFISSVTVFSFLFLARRKRAKFTEIVEDWELKYGPYRFQYKDLYLATKGFDEKKLLGKGGFGQVYEGELDSSSIKIAVKRVSHGSKQGMKEFIAEIATIGRLRHPNVMRLLGYCRLKDELLLVYDYMPNLSLDKFIFKTRVEESETLTWAQRFKIIKQVAPGIAYLHEGWVEVVIHRDIKASNVLLDNEMNAKLGDFGLARCISHAGQDPYTTNLAGTLGYIAPELARNGKATTCTDVFAFGAFCLEVACGRRPVESRAAPEQIILIDWVLECWKREDILGTLDSRLAMNDEDLVKEMGLVLQIGLICSHPSAAMRPTISQIVSYLNGQASLPENMEAMLLARDELTRDFDTSHVPQLCHSGPAISVSLFFFISKEPAAATQ